jgi:hypothetical protein
MIPGLGGILGGVRRPVLRPTLVLSTTAGQVWRALDGYNFGALQAASGLPVTFPSVHTLRHNGTRFLFGGPVVTTGVAACYTSLDGLAFASQATSPIDITAPGVVTCLDGSGGFYAVFPTTSGVVTDRSASSPDGQSPWTAGTDVPNGTAAARAIAREPGLGITAVFGQSGSLHTATLLGTWTSRSSGTGNQFNAAAAGGGYIVGVASGGVISASSNGTSYALATSGTTQDLLDVIWTGTQFLACGSTGNTLIRAANPTGTWTAVSLGAGFTRLCRNGDYVYAFGQNNVFISFDFGTNWLDITANLTGYGPSTFANQAA